MYYENSTVNREGWRYTYKGSDLLENSIKLKNRFKLLEMTARNKVSEMLSDPSIRQDDPELDKLRREIQNYGKNHEALVVFSHEFARCPDRDYHLALGDVVFFELC